MGGNRKRISNHGEVYMFCCGRWLVGLEEEIAQPMVLLSSGPAVRDTR